MLRTSLALVCTFAAVALGLPARLGAQQPSPTAAAAGAGPRIASTVRIGAAPLIDGVVDDRAWQDATPLTEFVQAEPFEGQPASERTEVRILYDESAIYVGVICFDSDPSGIITTDSRRDATLTDMDSFQFILDTYHDRQNGFVFGTNAAGLEYDAQVRNEGETQSGGAPAIGRVSAGSGGGTNVNWDGTWEVKARTSEIGWSAEFRIPLRTLRYGAPPQLWGVNFARTIRRKREQVFWAPLARIYNITRLSSAGELQGLDLQAPRNFKVTPYVTSATNRDFSAPAPTSHAGDWGVDAKFGITPSVNLDLTYNTDFAQVEVDEQQINLTRFNLLFPEKRPFFLENAGLFAVGRNGEIDLFFSRRIGISDDGALVPIRGGARLTGKTGGVNVGMLNMQTEGVNGTPANNFTAARINKELPNRSSIGGVFVNRTATGGGASSDDWNRTWGGNAKIGFGEHWTYSGFAARTETPGFVRRESAWSSGIEFRNRNRRTQLDFTQVGEDFNPEVGFLERPNGYRQLNTGWFENVRSAGLADVGFRELRPHVLYESYWNFRGVQETATLHMDTHLDWENGNYFSPAVNMQWEGLEVPFEVYPGVIVPAGRYRSVHTAWASNTDRKRSVSAGMAWNYGGFLSGTQNILSPSLTLQRGGKFTTTVRWTRSDIDLPQGAFATNLGAMRVTYNFTPSRFAQTLIQYNDRTSRWATNLRFSWLNAAGTGFFVVYNDTERFNGLGPIDRSFILKYSHQFDILR